MMGRVLPCLDGPVPFVMAHRGFDLDGLENSMRAFEAAVRLGVTFLETDVQVTADGVLLAFHDRRLNRVTGRPGRVGELPWSEVRTARIGGREPIPLLEDVLGTWPDVRVNVDLKVRGAVAPFVEAVRRTGARDRVCVAAFGDARRRAAVGMLREDGPVAWSPGVATLAALVPAVRAGRTSLVRRLLRGAACVQVPERFGAVPVATAGFVRTVHSVGVQVHVWTVDDPARMDALLDLGVDALVTNRSDLALPRIRARRDGAAR